MIYSQLGRSGLSVSRLVLGTMNFGPETPEDESHRIMDHAHDVGINYFDTANVYGMTSGAPTEEIIGRWIAGGGSLKRDKTVLATKVFLPVGEWPNSGRLSALHIRRACDESLRRLQTDHIDIYQMHHIDRTTPWEEIWDAFENLRQQGKVIYFGSSNFAGWQIAQAQASAESRHMLGLVSEQSIYNLATRWIELEVLPSAMAHGMGVVAWSPLHGGMLGGVLAKQRTSGTVRGGSPRTVAALERNRDAVERYEKLCADRGEHPAAVGLAWLLAQPGVTGPIVGPRTVQQLDESLSALEIEMDDDLLAQLDSIFPSPWPNGSAAAPEAYAW